MAETETTYDLMVNPRACPAFQWVGQSFEHCDRCGRPYWDHSHEEGLGWGGPFGTGWKLSVITRARAAAVEAKWRNTGSRNHDW